MKFHKILTFAAIAAISTSFAGCSDSDDNKFDNTILPISIVVNADDYVGRPVYTFNYQPTDANVKAVEGRIYSYSMSHEESYSEYYTIEYSATSNDITSITDANGIVFTYEYIPSPENPKHRIVKENHNGYYTDATGTYTINNKGLLVSEMYTYGSSPIVNYTLYEYLGNNITKISNILSDGKTVNNEMSFEQGKNSGVFRNVTTPQWFLMVRLKNVAMAESANNISKTELKHNYKSNGVDRKTTTLFDYEWFRGFPSKIDKMATTVLVDKNGEETKNTYNSTTTVTYNIEVV